MRRLYICDTPYQLFNMINIEYHKQKDNKGSEDTADIIITEQFSNFDFYLEGTKKTALFANAFVNRQVDYCSFDSNIKRKLFHARLIVDNKFAINYLMKSLNDDLFETFDEIYATYPSPIVRTLLRMNAKCDFYKVEDGLGSYVLNVWNEAGAIEKILYKVLRIKWNEKAFLVNNTKLYSSIPGERLPLPKVDDEFMSFFSDYFNTNIEHYSEKIIWLATASSDFTSDGKSVLKEAKSIISTLIKYKDSIAVRLHPREKNKELFDPFRIDKNQINWEYILSKCDMTDKVLIGDFSTAQVTPKLMYNQEPTLIFLYKVDKEGFYSDSYNELDRFVDSLRKSYSKPDSIFVPSNYIEFKKILRNVMD